MELENLTRRQRIKDIFESIDFNHDGVVDRRELMEAVRNAGNLPEHVHQNLFDTGDVNNDGQITFEEFCNLVDKPEASPFFQKFFNIPGISEIVNKAGKYWDNCKWWPPPIINLTFVLAQVIIHIIDKDSRKLQDSLMFQPNNEKEAWRYYTYSLIHQNWSHLIGNSFFQLAFGTALEPVHGPWVALLYVLGVVAGSLLHSVTNHGASLVGASAGASALILAWLSDVCLNFSEQACPMLSLVPVIVFILWQWIMTSGTTSVPAHISGAISGFLFGFIALTNIEEHRFERVIVKIAIALGVIYILFLVLLNAFNIYI